MQLPTLTILVMNEGFAYFPIRQIAADFVLHAEHKDMKTANQCMLTTARISPNAIGGTPTEWRAWSRDSTRTRRSKHNTKWSSKLQSKKRRVVLKFFP